MPIADPREALLGDLMSRVGFAVWQLQELETAVAGYLVVRLHAERGMGLEAGNELLRRAEGRTFGSLIGELSREGVIEERLGGDLKELLEERNWLVHRARRENRGMLSDPYQAERLATRLDRIAERALELLKRIGTDTELYVCGAGVSKETIDRISTQLARAWGHL